MKRLFSLPMIAAFLMLLAASPLISAADFDYRLAARPLAKDVYAFIGKTEDFNTDNGGNIVNTAFIVAPRSRSRHLNLAGQAFADVPIAALAETRSGIAADGNAFAENLYRMSGDWMKGTEVQLPTKTLTAGRIEVAGRSLRLVALDGHTGADLVIIDEASGVLFSGDLVFNGRAPTTPHADVAHWLKALDQLEALTRESSFKTLLPGHGAPTSDAAPIRQTRAWLNWLTATMRDSAKAGLDMNDVLARPLPPEFANLPVAAAEYRRSVGHLFPAAEQDALGADK